ncbi:unnamed protein product [Enterobius vermicularis]|uniref:CCDC92 domain-containing protein n=1 Tax=Enterobius vermicularis TaxID=51028 RepID=A0A0N4VP04_ENTVE|nr:unnamed protein product [Enterobius vermicularis]
MDETTRELNKLAIMQLKLFSDFLQVSKQLESVLDSYRYNLSKTKSILGFSTTAAAFLDSRDMEPTVRVTIQDGVFELDGNEPATSNSKPHFRPFGVFEPQHARLARKNITSSLSLICELASIKKELIDLESKYSSLRELVEDRSGSAKASNCGHVICVLRTLKATQTLSNTCVFTILGTRRIVRKMKFAQQYPTNNEIPEISLSVVTTLLSTGLLASVLLVS